MLVLAELESDKGELIPADFKPFTSGAGRRRDKFTQFWITSRYEDIATVAARYPYRVGVGATEIWNIFPEFRNEFVAKIERTPLEGSVVQIDQALKTTIAGDRLVSNELRLSDVDFRLWNEQHMPGHGPHDRMETITVSDSTLDEYNYLVGPDATETTVVTNKHMFFCEYFSLTGLTGEIAPGVRFLSPKALREKTDFLQVYAERTKPVGKFSRPIPYLPPLCTGVFIIDAATKDDFSGYSDALVNRIFPASALGSVPT